MKKLLLILAVITAIALPVEFADARGGRGGGRGGPPGGGRTGPGTQGRPNTGRGRNSKDKKSRQLDQDRSLAENRDSIKVAEVRDAV